jgi:simple sugar transport system ATP-binding protein
MTVLRNGKLVGEYRTGSVSQFELVEAMIGRELETLEKLEQHASVEAPEGRVPLVKVLGLSRRGSLQAVDLEIYDGQVIGIAGLLGSGRTELARLLFGADTADTGSIDVRGIRRRFRTPRHAIGAKIAFSSENRRAEGVVEDLTVADNLLLTLQAARGWLRPVPVRTRERLVAEYIQALDIRPPDPDALMRNLSGGNQQKVLLARWLITEPELLILDEPTRGIDIGAKTQIQQLVAKLATDGLSVVFISAELEEVLRLSHRVLVMRDRAKIADRLNDDSVTVAGILELIAAGGTAAAEGNPDA